MRSTYHGGYWAERGVIKWQRISAKGEQWFLRDHPRVEGAHWRDLALVGKAHPLYWLLSLTHNAGNGILS